MYKLALDADFAFLVHQRLIQAAFGQHDLILSFDETEFVSITVSSAIGCVTADGACRRVDNFRDAASFVLDLLGMPVEFARATAVETLSIGFENGQRIEIYDDSDQYESFVIDHSGITIAV